jgi:hypothetical protein
MPVNFFDTISRAVEAKHAARQADKHFWAELSQQHENANLREREIRANEEAERGRSTRADAELALRQEQFKHAQEAAAALGIGQGVLRPAENQPTVGMPGMIGQLQGPGEEPQGVAFGGQKVVPIPPEQQQARAENAARLIRKQTENDYQEKVSNILKEHGNEQWVKDNKDELLQDTARHQLGLPPAKDLTESQETAKILNGWAHAQTQLAPTDPEYKFHKARYDALANLYKLKGLANPMTGLNYNATTVAPALLQKAQGNLKANHADWDKLDDHTKAQLLHGEVTRIASDPTQLPPGTHPAIAGLAAERAHQMIGTVSAPEDPMKGMENDLMKQLFPNGLGGAIGGGMLPGNPPPSQAPVPPTSQIR